MSRLFDEVSAQIELVVLVHHRRHRRSRRDRALCPQTYCGSSTGGFQVPMCDRSNSGSIIVRYWSHFVFSSDRDPNRSAGQRPQSRAARRRRRPLTTPYPGPSPARAVGHGKGNGQEPREGESESSSAQGSWHRYPDTLGSASRSPAKDATTKMHQRARPSAVDARVSAATRKEAAPP